MYFGTCVPYRNYLSHVNVITTFIYTQAAYYKLPTNYLAMTVSATLAKRLLAHISPTLYPSAGTANPAALERLTAHLISANFCPRCVLRFIGIRDRALHRQFPSLIGVLKVENEHELLQRLEAEGAPPFKKLKAEIDEAHADMEAFVENGKGVKRERDADDEGGEFG